MSAPGLPRTHPTVVHMLADAAARVPGAEALVCRDERLNYAEYSACVSGFARELHALGARGQRVATLIENSIESCVAAFGALAAGALDCGKSRRNWVAARSRLGARHGSFITARDVRAQTRSILVSVIYRHIDFLMRR